MDGEAVLEAVHAARVLGNVAADAAGELTRWIGRVIEPMRRGGIRYGEVAHARLDSCRARVQVHFKYAHEPGEREQHAVAEGQRATREPGAGAARNHGRAQLV